MAREIGQADLAIFAGKRIRAVGRAPRILDFVDEFGIGTVLAHFGYLCRLMAIGMVALPWQKQILLLHA